MIKSSVMLERAEANDRLMACNINSIVKFVNEALREWNIILSLQGAHIFVLLQVKIYDIAAGSFVKRNRTHYWDTFWECIPRC